MSDKIIYLNEIKPTEPENFSFVFYYYFNNSIIYNYNEFNDYEYDLDDSNNILWNQVKLKNFNGDIISYINDDLNTINKKANYFD